MKEHGEKYKVIRRKLANLRRIIDMELQGEIDLPKEVVILSLDDKEKTEIFSQERMKLLRTIEKENPRTIGSLSKMVRRKIEAVSRDLSILKKYHIIETKRNKGGLQPIISKKAVIMPLVEVKPIKKMVEVCR